MRVTIQKTIGIDEMPKEISTAFKAVIEKVRVIENVLLKCDSSTGEGRYVDASEHAEQARLALTLLDKNIEEAQSLCLSYENIRIANQMPSTEPGVPDDE